MAWKQPGTDSYVFQPNTLRRVVKGNRRSSELTRDRPPVSPFSELVIALPFVPSIPLNPKEGLTKTAALLKFNIEGTTMSQKHRQTFRESLAAVALSDAHASAKKAPVRSVFAVPSY
jgi:hypothetical protein